MSKNSTIAVIVVILVIIGGYFLLSSEKAVAPTEGTTNTMPVPDAANTPEKIVTHEGTVITYGANGFSPSPVTINVGDTVTWKNESSIDIWPASAMHPTHTVYPGSDIQKCNTSAEAGIFDACRGIKPGASWSFVFTQKGSWNYHNHLNPRNFGKIIVQ